jgi:uncharacterized membrane protein
MKPIIAVPATLALILRAWSKNSLTPAGIFAATVTAIAHAYHPWNLPFALLCVFFLAGTRVTHVLFGSTGISHVKHANRLDRLKRMSRPL